MRRLAIGAVVLAPTLANAADNTDCVGPEEPPPAADAPTPSPTELDPSLKSDAPAPTEQTEQTEGEQVPEQTAAEAMGRTPKRVKCLDETLVDEFGRARTRKGVQPRFFRKALRLVISAQGGLFAGDLLDTQWQGGGNVAFWISEDFGIDAEFKITPMTFRLERAATGFTQENRYPDGVADNLAYITTAHVLWAPMHTKLRARKQRIVHGDFTLFAGAGPVFHDSVQGVGFDVGMSIYFYVTRFISIRLDLSDLILAQEAFASRRISNNLMFSSGVGIWIPFRLRG